jgi:DNA-directed RNA polymerase subunit RPC12/RpoP
MSEAQIICPNCGFKASHFYCAHCGQENHLHQETFGSLVRHFFGHYFHYENRFWDTLKVLCTKPGGLTAAYLKGQRAKYLHPVSLLIFITIFSVITSTLAHKVYDKFQIGVDPPVVGTARYELPELKRLNYLDKAVAVFYDDVLSDPIYDLMDHNSTAIFFCMIPVFLLLLKLVYIGRKDFTTGDHCVFAFHFHAFWFFTLFFNACLPDSEFYWSLNLTLLTTGIYLVIALYRVYGNKWMTSISLALLIFILYLIAFLLFSALIFSLGANWIY